MPNSGRLSGRVGRSKRAMANRRAGYQPSWQEATGRDRQGTPTPQSAQPPRCSHQHNQKAWCRPESPAHRASEAAFSAIRSGTRENRGSRTRERWQAEGPHAMVQRRVPTPCKASVTERLEKSRRAVRRPGAWQARDGSYPQLPLKGGILTLPTNLTKTLRGVTQMAPQLPIRPTA